MYNKSKQTGHIMLHRFLLNALDDKRIIDHINGNPLDNRKSNLRFITQTQNCWNATPIGCGKSGRRGVYWTNKTQKWNVGITCNGVKHYLGAFNALNEAIAVREAAEIRYFGEYRRQQKEQFNNSETALKEAVSSFKGVG